MNIKSLILYVSTLCLMITIVGQASAQPTIDVIADVVQFRGDGARTRWEFQYSFADTAVKYVVAPTGFIGELYCGLELVSELGDTTRDEWIASAQSMESAPKHQRFYSGVRPLVLTPGRYRVRFVARDLHDPSSALTSEFSSTVLTFSYRVSMSDVMFVMPLRAGVDPRFDRNGQAADPNPRHEIIGRDPSICVYAEIYNTLRSKLDTFALEIQVLDNVLEEQQTSYVRMIGQNDGLVIREEIPAGALRSGVYTLRIRVMSNDLATTYETREERFYILNPELPPEGRILLTEDEAFQASEWSVVKGERLALELELSDVLALNAEKAVRVQCTDERSQQRYLFRFWGIRDPDPSTQSNERLDDFRKMFKRAQTFYGNAIFRDGWRTDRGLALLRWGIATQVEQFVAGIDTKPYEIWFYQSIQGGSYFYFVDWQLQQNHRLVHSTMIGQVKEPNWYNLYAKAFSPNPSPASLLQPNQR
ncbi:MAG: GWxTD domain-containing protein [Candidatus Kapabacteria bacterium]|nr:GWxTD domain-containing protein [Candidatus Kapabacteria bacterium]